VCGLGLVERRPWRARGLSTTGVYQKHGELRTFLIEGVDSYFGERSHSERTNGQRAATYPSTSQRRHQHKNMEMVDLPSSLAASQTSTMITMSTRREPEDNDLPGVVVDSDDHNRNSRRRKEESGTRGDIGIEQVGEQSVDSGGYE